MFIGLLLLAPLADLLLEVRRVRRQQLLPLLLCGLLPLIGDALPRRSFSASATSSARSLRLSRPWPSSYSRHASFLASLTALLRRSSSSCCCSSFSGAPRVRRPLARASLSRRRRPIRRPRPASSTSPSRRKGIELGRDPARPASPPNAGPSGRRSAPLPSSSSPSSRATS
jgi:hypothetical protein